MIKVLHNPKSEEYLRFKEFILSNDMTWGYNSWTTTIEKEGHTNVGMYVHGILVAPENTPCRVPSVTDKACLILFQNFAMIFWMRMVLK